MELKDGSYHEDVGCGIGDAKQRGAAIEKAKKECVTDATKRALRLFGPALGNSVYNKDHMKSLKGSRAAKGSVFAAIEKDRTDAAALQAARQAGGQQAGPSAGASPQAVPHFETTTDPAQQQKQMRLLQQQKKQEELKRRLAANVGATTSPAPALAATQVRAAPPDQTSSGGSGGGGEKRPLSNSGNVNNCPGGAALGDLNFDDFPSCSQLDREMDSAKKARSS